MYRVEENSNLYHCGYLWLVLDECDNILSKHVTEKSAREYANNLNERYTQKHDAARRLMEIRREFLELSKIIDIETVYSDSMLGNIINICQLARERRQVREGERK
ncbi:MAG: hypothetical protein FWG70_01085 [Oscillospiraceae bacterium]|nr:hypothetical protein [Oscillospiraceae bacterium]